MVSGLNMSSEWSIDTLLFPVQLSVDLRTADSCFLASGKYDLQHSGGHSSAKHVLLCDSRGGHVCF